MSWNGFPRRVRNSILNRLTNKQPRTQENVPEDDDRKTISIRLPYMGKHGERLTNQLLRKLKRCFKSAVNFKVLFDTRKISSFCSTKDKIPYEQSSSVIYKINCPGCGEDYVGKSDRCFGIRMNCQGSRDNEPMFRHLHDCTKFSDLCKMLTIGDIPDNYASVFNVDNYIYVMRFQTIVKLFSVIIIQRNWHLWNLIT